MSNPTTKQPHDTRAKEPRLTVKQENFCLAYLETGNATEAYRRSYSASKMSPEAINVAAFRLTENPKIKLRIDELRAPALAKLEVTQEKTLRRLMQGQEFDIRRLYHPGDHPTKANQLKQPYELDEDTAKAVVGVKYDKDTGVLIEYKIIDVKGCAELLGKHKKLFNDVGSKENPLHIDKLPDEMLDARLAALIAKG